MIRPEHAGVGVLGLFVALVVVGLYVYVGWNVIGIIALIVLVSFCIVWAIGAITMKSWWPFG